VSRADEYESLLQDVTLWIDEAKQQANRSLHALLTTTYWRIGRRIVEQEQQGQQRADYGERLVEQLAKDLSARYGRGFSRANVFQMRQFYLAYRHKVQTASGQFAPSFVLSWSHYVRLLTVADPAARQYYETEAVRGGWSVRDLDRQIATQAYQRLRGQPAPALSSVNSAPHRTEEHIRDPFILEFLNLKDEYAETDFEQALIDSLERFLLELGNDFAFIGRQRRLRIGTEWYRIDLLFFHRRLRCLVIIDLKVGKFTHADAGQMNLYLNYAREHWTHPEENPPVGIILCSEQDTTVARYALGGMTNTVLAREYQLALPDEQQLAKQLESTRQRLLNSGS
jgi:predicted nuclease of restriction endonuclease-like (RecB) superfamily